MRKSITVFGAAASLVACSGGGERTANQGANAAATAKKAKPTYCFFKQPDTKGWAVSRDEHGNVVVKGKAYRQDPRYMAVLGPAVVTGNRAEITPSITLNNTGYGAPGNWWDVSATIPDSVTVEAVTVSCGSRTLAELKLPPKTP
jgi:hypothetical protein